MSTKYLLGLRQVVIFNNGDFEENEMYFTMNNPELWSSNVNEAFEFKTKDQVATFLELTKDITKSPITFRNYFFIKSIENPELK